MPDVPQVPSRPLTGGLIPASDRIQNRLGVAVGIFVDKNKAPFEVGIEPTNDGYEPPALTILAIRPLLLVPFYLGVDASPEEVPDDASDKTPFFIITKGVSPFISLPRKQVLLS